MQAAKCGEEAATGPRGRRRQAAERRAGPGEAQQAPPRARKKTPRWRKLHRDSDFQQLPMKSGRE